MCRRPAGESTPLLHCSDKPRPARDESRNFRSVSSCDGFGRQLVRLAGDQPDPRVRHPAGRAGARIMAPPHRRSGDCAALARGAARIIDDGGPALIVGARADEEGRSRGQTVDHLGLVERRGAHRHRLGPHGIAGGAAPAAGGEAGPELADGHGHHRLAQPRRLALLAHIRRRGRAVAAAPIGRPLAAGAAQDEQEREGEADFHEEGFSPSVRALEAVTGSA